MVTPRRLTTVVTLSLAVVLAVSLSACSPLSLFASWGETPAPSKSAHTAEAGPTESPSPTSTPTRPATSGCVDRVISAPGTYRIDNCENLIVSGSGVTVTAAHLGTLMIMGDSLKVYAQSIGALEVNGDLNTVQTSDNVHMLKLAGDRNMITCHGSMTTAEVTGDDNTVVVDGGVDGDVQNNGQRNSIGGQP